MSFKNTSYLSKLPTELRRMIYAMLASDLTIQILPTKPLPRHVEPYIDMREALERIPKTGLKALMRASHFFAQDIMAWYNDNMNNALKLHHVENKHTSIDIHQPSTTTFLLDLRPYDGPQPSRIFRWRHPNQFIRDFDNFYGADRIEHLEVVVERFQRWSDDIIHAFEFRSDEEPISPPKYFAPNKFSRRTQLCLRHLLRRAINLRSIRITITPNDKLEHPEVQTPSIEQSLSDLNNVSQATLEEIAEEIEDVEGTHFHHEFPNEFIGCDFEWSLFAAHFLKDGLGSKVEVVGAGEQVIDIEHVQGRFEGTVPGMVIKSNVTTFKYLHDRSRGRRTPTTTVNPLTELLRYTTVQSHGKYNSHATRYNKIDNTDTETIYDPEESAQSDTMDHELTNQRWRFEDDMEVDLNELTLDHQRTEDTYKISRMYMDTARDMNEDREAMMEFLQRRGLGRREALEVAIREQWGYDSDGEGNAHYDSMSESEGESGYESEQESDEEESDEEESDEEESEEEESEHVNVEDIEEEETEEESEHDMDSDEDREIAQRFEQMRMELD